MRELIVLLPTAVAWPIELRGFEFHAEAQAVVSIEDDAFQVIATAMPDSVLAVVGLENAGFIDQRWFKHGVTIRYSSERLALDVVRCLVSRCFFVLCVGGTEVRRVDAKCADSYVLDMMKSPTFHWFPGLP
jgi:hypothetical protein